MMFTITFKTKEEETHLKEGLLEINIRDPRVLLFLAKGPEVDSTQTDSK